MVAAVLDSASRQGRPGSAELAALVAWSWQSLDPALVDPDADPTAVLPYLGAGTRTFYWELHFSGESRVRADFLHRPALDAKGNSDRGSPDPIVDTLSAWHASGDTRRYCHGSAWLELDGPLIARRAFRQGVSVCLDPEIGQPRTSDPARLAYPTEVVLDTFSRLQEACGAPPEGAHTLARVHRAVLASAGALRHLSVMRGRPGALAKIYAALPKPALPAFLTDAGWPGEREPALWLADLACADSARVNLDLAFDTELTPRIAFEQFFDPSPARDPLRRNAVELATALGLLTREQAAGLGRWVRSFHWGLGGGATRTRVQRWLDLKFVLARGGLEFKAYLGFRLCEDAA